MLDAKQNKLFKLGYRAYQRIYAFCIENMDSLFENEDKGTRIAIVMLSDIEVQYILLEIADCSHYDLTDSEQTFVRSIVESGEMLKSMIPGYGRFIRKMTSSNYHTVKNEFERRVSDIPLSLVFAAKKGIESASEIYGCWKSILNSFVAISEDYSIRKNEKVVELLQKYRAFLEREGHSIIKNDEIQADDSDENSSKQSAVQELYRLVGLSAVKREIVNNLNFLKVNDMRVKEGLDPIAITKHLVFTGNPGTGKTTVARILAKIYHENGISSNGQLVETDRSGLVDTIIGGTAQKVLNTVDSAIGGVLFIDEAYALSPEDSVRDFGQEAIATLVKLMDDHRDDLVVIVAGYKDEMKRFIDSNPGLKSRFTGYIDFADYSPDEMQEIYSILIKKDGYSLNEGCMEKLMEIWNHACEDSSFGNGRGVRNVYEKTLVNLATRVVGANKLKKEDLVLILPQDIPDSKEVIGIAERKRRIGFL